MRVEAKHLAPQFFVKAGHHCDDDDENGDAKGDAEDGNERDDRDECPLWLQITKREKKTEGDFHEKAGHIDSRWACPTKPNFPINRLTMRWKLSSLPVL